MHSQEIYSTNGGVLYVPFLCLEILCAVSTLEDREV